MSVQVLRQLMSATERSRGGLRIRLDPSALERACAEREGGDLQPSVGQRLS